MDDKLIGKTIGGYHIVEEIGQGGMATVFRAHQISMNRDVAIKILPLQFLHHAASLDRFKQEASIVARLEHRAIVPVHDYGEHEGVPYIVMRYMDGGSVDDLLAKSPIPPGQTLQIIQQIAPALDYAHREGVLHRDLKPSNILLDANEDAYITDFGIARILGTPSNRLTTSGVVGTPSYMSPEQAQGHELDGRSDVYALGVVLFEMLTGTRPFEGETPYSVAVKHVTEAPPSICGVNPRLPHALDPVLYKALAKNREVRFQTASELAQALQSALEVRPITPLSTEGLIQTEPSLNKALQEEAARRRVDTSRALLASPVMDARVMPPDSQAMPVYVSPPPMSQGYTGPWYRPHPRPKGPRWTTWATVGLLVVGLLVAFAIGAAYYMINSADGGPGSSPVEDYDATAIFKLTATKQAILGTTEPLEPPATLPILQPTLTPTIPPTNTVRAESEGGASP
jgi:serine/threonine protein kinase